MGNDLPDGTSRQALPDSTVLQSLSVAPFIVSSSYNLDAGESEYFDYTFVCSDLLYILREFRVVNLSNRYMSAIFHVNQVSLGSYAGLGSIVAEFNGPNDISLVAGNTCQITYTNRYTAAVVLYATMRFDVLLKPVNTVLAPVSNFTYDLVVRPHGTPITFTDLSINNPTYWLWSFGDGEYSTEQNPVHTYAAAGTYNLWMRSFNAGGSGFADESSFVIT